jgi:hypothetical protein
MVPQSSAAGGNRSYLDFLAVIGDPWYPGYKTPTIMLLNFHLEPLMIIVWFKELKYNILFHMFIHKMV